jgi:hypothetical protein
MRPGHSPAPTRPPLSPSRLRKYEKLDKKYAAHYGVTVEEFRAQRSARQAAECARWAESEAERFLNEQQHAEQRAAPRMRRAELAIRTRDLGLARIAALVGEAESFERRWRRQPQDSTCAWNVGAR